MVINYGQDFDSADEDADTHYLNCQLDKVLAMIEEHQIQVDEIAHVVSNQTKKLENNVYSRMRTLGQSLYLYLSSIINGVVCHDDHTLLSCLNSVSCDHTVQLIADNLYFFENLFVLVFAEVHFCDTSHHRCGMRSNNLTSCDNDQCHLL